MIGERPRRVVAWLVGDKIPGEVSQFLCRVPKPTQRAAILASLFHCVEAPLYRPLARAVFGVLKLGRAEH